MVVCPGTKGGVIASSKALARELAAKGISSDAVGLRRPHDGLTGTEPVHLGRRPDRRAVSRRTAGGR
jgi:hypothetical protein